MFQSIFIFLLSLIVPIIVYILSTLLYIKSNTDRIKISPFECGFDTFNKSRIPFSTRFFLLSVLFVIFDIEIVLITPFPIIINLRISISIIITYIFIIIVLILGLIHEWNEGSLNWNN